MLRNLEKIKLSEIYLDVVIEFTAVIIILDLSRFIFLGNC